MRKLSALSANAIRRSLAGNGDEVVWLTPRGQKRNARCGRRFHLWLVRFGVTIAVGAAANVLSSGAAIAPAIAHSGTELRVELGLPSILPVERAPIPITAAMGTSLEAVLRAQLDDADPAALGLNDMLSEALAPETPPAGGRTGRPAEASDPTELVRFGAMEIPRGVVETILRAAAVTGVDPVYMMALADKESSFSPEIKARTSSAEGLFQFIAKTWLAMVRTHGAKHGLAEEAAAVELVDGQPTIRDEALRERVLGLRRDPYLSAVMAAEMLKRDRAAIERRIGRDLNRSELYLAHFLGAEGAGKLMTLVDQKPKQSAPRLFKDAAKANRNLFFARQGKRMKDLTVAEVYDKIDDMIDRRINRYVGVERLITVSELASAM